MRYSSHLFSVAAFGIAAFVVTACGPVDGDYRQHAEYAVSKQLGAAESAQFEREFQIVGGRDYDVVVCGFVNTKNGHGGYTGPMRFAAFQWRSGNWSSVLEDVGDSDPAPGQHTKIAKATVFENAYWNVYCTDAEHPPTYTATTLRS